MHITQLDKIISDLSYIDLNDPYDMGWLAERINIRALHGTHAIGRCDGCSDGSAIPVIRIVDDYPDDMGAPSSLGISQVCRYHLNDF
jgi:hypothetical protein